MKQYMSLMKLRVVELLLVTTVPALFLATNGIPDLSLTFWSLLGGTLAAGGANAFNMVIESDTDKLMKRTANRPISTGQISKRNALLFSSIISLLSLAGYTSSGEKEYVFVVIADGVGRTKRSQNAARSAIDRMLGTITKPVVIALTPPTVENNPVAISQ